MASRLYFLTINLNMGDQSGINLPGTVEKVSKLLCSYKSATKCLHKFKVTGEDKIVAVFEVTNVIGLERMVGGIARLGNINITCKPLKPYEKYAQMLKVDDGLTTPSTNCIAKDKELFWLDFTIQYPGKSSEELLATLAKEATAVLEARKGGVHLEMFKGLGERKVQVFVVMEPDDLDTLTFNLPVMAENGNGVKIVSHAIQDLEDYCKRMISEKL